MLYMTGTVESTLDGIPVEPPNFYRNGSRGTTSRPVNGFKENYPYCEATLSGTLLGVESSSPDTLVFTVVVSILVPATFLF